MLTTDQVEFYHTNGYVTVAGVLRSEEIEELRRVTEEFVEASRLVTEESDVYILEEGHSAENPKPFRIQSPSKHHSLYERMSRHEGILDCVESLIGPNIRFQGEKLNLKTGDGGSAVEWHQDFAFYPHTNDSMLAVGVALDDCTVDNGCLLFIPGSHKKMLDHHHDGHFVGAITPSREDVDLRNSEPVEVKAGSISIHHVCALHGSVPNRSGKPRRLLLLQYAAVDALPLGGVPDYDEFNKLIVRGEVTYDFRMGDIMIRVPHNGQATDGAIFGIQKFSQEKVLAEK